MALRDRTKIYSGFSAGSFARALRCTSVTAPLPGDVPSVRLVPRQNLCAAKPELILARSLRTEYWRASGHFRVSKGETRPLHRIRSQVVNPEQGTPERNDPHIGRTDTAPEILSQRRDGNLTKRMEFGTMNC